MQDLIAGFFLKFGQEVVLVPCLILGYLILNKELFFRAIYLILLSMILNVVLKMSFKVPLFPHLNKEGFAFPSGHMQSCIVFYGWLFLNTTRKYFRVLLICLLIGIGWSLVYFRYHDYKDILGAAFFGVGILFIHNMILKKKFNFTILMFVIFIFATLLMFWIWKCYRVTLPIWQAYYILTGLLLGGDIFHEKILNKDSIYSKLLSIFIYVMFLITSYMFVRNMFSFPYIIREIWCLIIGFSLPTSVFLSIILLRKKIVQKN